MCVEDLLEVLGDKLEKDTTVKDFDVTIALAEYHTRGLFSAVVLKPKEYIPESR